MKTTMYIVWAVAIVLFGVAEGVTAQLVSIWFVIGAIAGLIATFLGATVPVQIVVFVATSIIALLLTRPLVKKKLTPRIESTNADRCIGQEAIVVERIDNISATGQVKADGKLWTARSSNGEVIEANEIVTIERIDGVKLIVAQRQNANV